MENTTRHKNGLASGDQKMVTRKTVVGGGPKKLLYTLGTVRNIGFKKASKALKAKNACKACALGMGGQRGGMTNEFDEFPSVCNKSIQAQSTDIQPAIPDEIFSFPLDDWRELSAYELEHLGRLNTPLHKPKGSDRFEPISWENALRVAASKLTATDPDRTFFYSSGRSSNEAGFVLQLMARLFGTNSVNNCSFYCHQATSEGLKNTIGAGTATIELADLAGADLVFVIGANPSSNHPRFIHQLKNCRERGGDVVIINPAKEPGLVRFAVPKSVKSMVMGGTWIASEYLQPNIGTDIALLKGIAKAVIEQQGVDQAFIDQYTNNFSKFLADINASHWCDITNTCGIAKEAIERVAKCYCDATNVVFAWGMGMTHHTHGVENIEYIVNLALLRGMVGKRYAGLLPLRGHSNVQGIGTIGVKPILEEDVIRNIEQHLSVQFPKKAGYDTLAGLKAASEGKIDAALMMGGNLYGASPHSVWAEQAINNIGFKLFLTTTLNKGHVHGLDDGESLILPVTARDEEWQPTTQESMFNYVRLSTGGITRLDNVRPEVTILSDIAQRILPNCPVNFERFKQHSNIRQAIAHSVPGMEQLVDIDVAKSEFHVRNRLIHTPFFNTQDNKANFNVHPTSIGRSCSTEYPFQLMSVRSEGQFNTIIYEENDSYRGTTRRWVVMMSPQDMAGMNLTKSCLVDLESAYGKMSNLNVHPFDLPPGNVMAYFPEANILIGLDADPRSKTPAFKSVSVKLVLSS